MINAISLYYMPGSSVPFGKIFLMSLESVVPCSLPSAIACPSQSPSLAGKTYLQQLLKVDLSVSFFSQSDWIKRMIFLSCHLVPKHHFSKHFPLFQFTHLCTIMRMVKIHRRIESSCSLHLSQPAVLCIL